MIIPKKNLQIKNHYSSFWFFIVYITELIIKLDTRMESWKDDDSGRRHQQDSAATPSSPRINPEFRNFNTHILKSETRNSRSRATSKYPRDNPKILRALGRGSGNTDYFEMCFDVRASVSNVYPRSSNKRRSISAWKIRVIIYFDIDWIFDLSLALLERKERKEKYFRIIVIYLSLARIRRVFTKATVLRPHLGQSPSLGAPWNMKIIVS